jgi:hypothetical protein
MVRRSSDELGSGTVLSGLSEAELEVLVCVECRTG